MKDVHHPSLPAEKLLAYGLTQEQLGQPLLELLLRANHYTDLVLQLQTFVDCIKQHNMLMWPDPLELLTLLNLLQKIWDVLVQRSHLMVMPKSQNLLPSVQGMG